MSPETLAMLREAVSVEEYEVGLPLIWACPGLKPREALYFGNHFAGTTAQREKSRPYSDQYYIGRGWYPNLSTPFGMDWARRLLAKRLGWGEIIGGGILWYRPFGKCAGCWILAAGGCEKHFEWPDITDRVEAMVRALHETRRKP